MTDLPSLIVVLVGGGHVLELPTMHFGYVTQYIYFYLVSGHFYAIASTFILLKG